MKFKFHEGSSIYRPSAQPEAFPDPSKKGEQPANETLKLFISQCLQPARQPLLKAVDWNNLGCAYASLPRPELKLAKEAFLQGLSLQPSSPLKETIEENLKTLKSVPVRNDPHDWGLPDMMRPFGLRDADKDPDKGGGA